jgi:hypothetical protein
MFHPAHRALFLSAACILTMPALAQDCAVAARTAMLNSGRTPVSTMTSSTDAQGRKATTRTVQTVDNKYVQTKEGKWYSMGIAIKDLIDDAKTTKVTCQGSSRDTANGVAATVYAIQVDNDDSITQTRIWVADNLIFKSELTVQGTRYTTLYDYGHVTAPTGVTPMGTK